MNIDNEIKIDKKNGFRSLIVIALMGGVGIIIPFLSSFVATFKGVTELSLFNSSMLLVLAVLVILFLSVRTISALFESNSKLFIFGVVFIVANLISLISSLMIYLVL